MSSGLSVRKISFAGLMVAALLGAGCANQSKMLGAGGLGGAGGMGGMNGGGAGAATPGSAQDFQVNVGDRVFFNTDESSVNSQAAGILDRQAEWLNRYRQYTFTIEGHADERGTREYNIGLGARRANAARDYLVSRGVAAGRIRVVSYGKERPVALCSDNSCWSQNRRAVTVLSGR